MHKELRAAFASDLHLGNRKNSAASIIANLNKYLSCDKFMVTIDILFLVGDVFDEALWLSSEDVAHIDAWITRLLLLCKKHDVVIRVLEGTPSHDRLQSCRFTIINDILLASSGAGADLAHVQTLSIEYIERFDITVLYIPDEWNHLTEKTLEEVRELMRAKNLEQVDFGIFHGIFPFQMPAHIKSLPVHDEEAYEAIVRCMISIGHIHIHSHKGKIYAQGSFDRLSHGEEAPKGFLRAVVQPDGTRAVQFIENKGAKKHVTVYCPYEDMEDNLRVIDKVAEKLPAGSYVRVESNYLNPIITGVDTLKVRWPLLIWTTLAKGKEDKEDLSVISEEFVFIPITVSKDNIHELVMSRLAKHNLSADMLKRCADNLLEAERM